MSNIDVKILNELTDKDIKILCKNADLNMMMAPIKKNGKHYVKYMAQLGRMDKKSVLVRKNLPRIAFELYKKDDANYLNFFAMTATNFKMVFESMLHECMGENIEPQGLRDFSIDDYKKLFSEILKTYGLSLDLELFFLQIKLHGIAISEEVKSKIDEEWRHLKELDSVRKEIISSQREEIKKIEYEFHEEMKSQENQLKNQISELQVEEESLKANIDSKQKIIISLMGENESAFNELKKQKSVINCKRDEIEGLKRELKEAQIYNNEISKKLHAKTEDIYSQVQTSWEKENEDKVKKNKELEYKAAQCMETLRELKLKNEQIEFKVGAWDDYIDAYFAKLDKKIIEHRIDSLLYQKNYVSSSEVAVTSDNEVKYSDLYILKGHKVKDVEECVDYDDYIENVETNLSNIGDKMPIGTMYDCFNAAIDTGLHPLICGFGARQLALALTAARYAEKSEIISVPVGFNNTHELARAISSARTDSIILEDSFGTMNENLLLPILRDTNGKIVVLTSESTENLKYLQKHFYNYIQLIVVDKRANVKTCNFVYSDANKLFSERIYSGKEQGHKLARQIFEYIGMSNAYVLTRGNVFCELLVDNKDNTEVDILQKIFITELKWILNEGQQRKLEELLLANKDKFSKKLLESVCI